MKVDIKDYELMKDMAYDNREKFQMLHAKMLLIKEGESTLKEMYYDLVEKYQRKNQECEKIKKDNSEYYSIYKEENIKLNNIINEIEDFCKLACPVECRKIDCGFCDNIEPFEAIKAIKSVINKLQEKTNE